MVNAHERGLNQILQGPWQYQVPLYQRPYQWSDANRAQLWEDIVQLADERQDEESATHFLGSLVLSPSPGASAGGVQRFLVVDGQQRLTTLTLLLAAIRDHHLDTSEPRKADAVNERYLINKFEPEELRLKLVPTQADREAYLAVIDRLPDAGSIGPVGDAYRFFRQKLFTADDPEDPHDIDRIESAAMQGISLVVVTTDAGDNVHRIFESLNNTGLQLSQADLLRNYLFMRLPTKAEEVYRLHWKPLQDALTTDELEVLFWFDLARIRPTIKQTDTYSEQQKRLDKLDGEEAIADEVARLAKLGQLLRKVAHPNEEEDSDVRFRLRRLQQWDSTTVLPVLLHFLDHRAQGKDDSKTVARAMLAIESYLVRRLVVGRSSSNVNRTLLGLIAEADKDLPLDQAVLEYLSAGRKHFASDSAVREATALSPFYIKGRAQHRSLVLKWIEESFGSKEAADLSKTSIEHIMPQTLSDRWKAELAHLVDPDESVDDAHARLLHTLGNLTLTGYNSPLGNKPFDQKRTEFSKSGIRLNRFPAEAEEWGPAQIEERAELIADQIVRTWPGPIAVTGADDDSLWRRLNEVAASIPAGRWTTYGDVAAAIGTHPVPLAQRLSGHPVPNAYRVLTADGSVSSGFGWLNPDDERDVHDVLEAEGILFDAQRRAHPDQRLTVEDLVLGVESPDSQAVWSEDPESALRRVRFEFRGLLKRSLFRSGTLSPAELATWVITGEPSPNGRAPQWAPGNGPRQNDDSAAAFRQSPYADDALLLLRQYAARHLPWPNLTEGRHWSVSAMPRSNSLWALSVGGAYAADVTIDRGDLVTRLFVARSPMHGMRGGALAGLVGDSVDVTDSNIESGGEDQVVLHIRGSETAQTLLADPTIGSSIRLYNARLATMKNAWGTSHVPALLDGAW
ncbi:DUF262 domain-containing protein [Dietzia maris]|uniref:GmrSD restriction endonuclease domain-containing protein n=1 Tax=Dietzia maris TaxID=37915 RepID=UPI0022B3E703|nr:DUF262 domain-containing protein [Dietzia maris]MCZ4541745.1 DUF262 domain-containing protein [Dietzia maris]